MNYSIVSIQGKQFKVQPGDKITVDRLEGEVDSKIDLDQVLMQVSGDEVEIGQPLLEKAKIQAKIVDQHKGDKIRVAKFRSKSRYRRVQGHRQLQTTLEILGESQPKAKATPKKTASK